MVPGCLPGLKQRWQLSQAAVGDWEGRRHLNISKLPSCLGDRLGELRWECTFGQDRQGEVGQGCTWSQDRQPQGKHKALGVCNHSKTAVFRGGTLWLSQDVMNSF